MKIVVLAHTFPKFKGDSTAAFMEGFCQGLVRLGEKVTAVLPYDPLFKSNDPKRGFQVKPFKYLPIKSWHRFGYSRTLKNGQQLTLTALVLAPLVMVVGCWRLWQTVKKQQIDLISAHWIIPGGLIGALVSVLTGVPLIISAPGADIYLAKRYKIFGFLAWLASLRAKIVVVAGSPLWVDDLASIGVSSHKLYSINYGVDTKQFYPKSSLSLRRRLNFTKENLLILVVARLIPRKGVDQLIKALPAVVKKQPQVKVVIVGDGEQRQELWELAQRLKVSKNLTWVGFKNRQEIWDFYNLADIYFAGSNRDKKGTLDDAQISLIEAMACGKAAVVTDLPGNKQVIKDKINGFTFPMGRVDLLAKRLNQLIEDPQLRRSCGENNLKAVRQKYSIEAVAKEYLSKI